MEPNSTYFRIADFYSINRIHNHVLQKYGIFSFEIDQIETRFNSLSYFSFLREDTSLFFESTYGVTAFLHQLTTTYKCQISNSLNVISSSLDRNHFFRYYKLPQNPMHGLADSFVKDEGIIGFEFEAGYRRVEEWGKETTDDFIFRFDIFIETIQKFS